MNLKKSILNYLKIFQIIFVITSFSIEKISCFSLGDFPYVKRLNNGYYFIVSSKNIVICDSSMTTVINEINFNPPIYSSRDDTYSTSAEQFLSRDDEYLIAIIKQEIYIFSKNGEKLKNENITSINPKLVYSIVPYAHSGNDYYFVIIFAEKTNSDNNSLTFRKYTFNSNSKTLTADSDIIQYLGVNFENSISCKLMFFNNINAIHCIYGKWEIVYSTSFSPDNNFQVIQSLPTSNIYSSGRYFKNEIIPEKREIAIDCYYHDGKEFFCRTYNISSNTFGDEQCIGDNICGAFPSALIIEYFYETEETIVGCTGYGSKIFLGKFDNNLNFENLDSIKVPNATTLSKVNVVFPSNQNKYSVLVGIICDTCSNEIYFQTLDNINLNIINLDCPIYYNYEHNICIETIPEGYYCNSTEDKTIDKCHENCQTCNDGPKPNNNTCLTCKSSGTQYFDLGNCTESCINNYFLENSAKICKCSSNITCKYCSVESKEYNLCESCNTDLGYFPKFNDNNNKNSYINCYNSTTISEGYYLNNANGRYEPCYFTCKNCEELGIDQNNKCTECKDEYPINDSPNDGNCYQTCNNYYYFDDQNNYQCTTDNKCPEGYKTIESKKKCIKNCINDYQYKYEYNNYCYEGCPSDTIVADTTNKLCELKCQNFNKYYNYDKTECITSIPEGYYSNSSTLKTIDKCHDNCKTCEEGPTANNNKCLKCKDTNTFRKL